MEVNDDFRRSDGPQQLFPWGCSEPLIPFAHVVPVLTFSQAHASQLQEEPRTAGRREPALWSDVPGLDLLLLRYLEVVSPWTNHISSDLYFFHLSNWDSAPPPTPLHLSIKLSVKTRGVLLLPHT